MTMELETMDTKQKALIALTIAAEAFFVATNEALEEKFPGRGAQSRALLDEGKAHLCISVQVGSGQMQAALALVQPVFVDVLDAPEMTLKASIASIFGEPDNVKIVNLGKLN